MGRYELVWHTGNFSGLSPLFSGKDHTSLLQWSSKTDCFMGCISNAFMFSSERLKQETLILTHFQPCSYDCPHAIPFIDPLAGFGGGKGQKGTEEGKEVAMSTGTGEKRVRERKEG